MPSEPGAVVDAFSYTEASHHGHTTPSWPTRQHTNISETT
jgi:hypothetical protein